MSTRTANLGVFPNTEHDATSGDISSAKHGSILDVKYGDNTTTTFNIGKSGNPSAN
jgi:hypothetical protein